MPPSTRGAAAAATLTAAAAALVVVLARRRRRQGGKTRFGSERVEVPFLQDVYGLGAHTTKGATTIEIRLAKARDAATLRRLIVGLAAYEKEPESTVQTTEADLLRDGLAASTPKFYCLLAEDAGEAVGLALFYDSYSTWSGPCTYLEDLFVVESHRKHGLGSLLLKSVAAVAYARGHARLHWNALDWNTPAITFYTQKCNAQLLTEWQTLRMPRTTMRSFLGLPP